ncbi:MAG: site-2 protease family protein [Candidatus Aenigmarchaeota archaeon]|nr:site-2 protease family protein [Candidatus Aenigmarchaeota archaeon]
MDLEVLSVLIFLGILSFLIYWDRKNIEFKFGLIRRRTKMGKKAIYKFGDKHRKKLKIIGNIAIIVGIIASASGLFLLIRSSYNLFLKPEEAMPEIKLVFPSVSGIELPGFILGVPFWYWIIAVFVVMFAHEPMHALVARAERIKIKSFGLLLLFVLPGAFVDPDERQVKKLSTVKKLRIFAAGSFGNLIVAGIFFLLILSYNFLIDSFISAEGVVFEKTIENTGASDAGLKGTIIKINDKEVKSIADFLNIMKDVKVGDVLKIETTQGIFHVKTIPNPENPEKPFIGINKPSTLFVYKGIFEGLGVVPESTLHIISWFLGLFGWVFVLNIGIGVFNLFPIKPLDGGLMLEAIVKHFYKGKGAKYLVNCLSLLTLSLVLINLFGPSFLAWVR